MNVGATEFRARPGSSGWKEGIINDGPSEEKDKR